MLDRISDVNKRTENVIIADESDDTIFKDLELFYNKISGANSKIVCLTATPDDGNEKGSEKAALASLDFKIFRNAKEGQLEMPNWDATMDLSSIEKIMEQVEKRRKDQAVLIFATDELYDKLLDEDYVKPVNDDTPNEELRSMDKKVDGVYPVYLINEENGMRGIDYRSANNRLGICMLIVSPFSDRRSRIQGLNRVGRYTDACYRIQNEKALHIDEYKSVANKAKIAAALKKILPKKIAADQKKKAEQKGSM